MASHDITFLGSSGNRLAAWLERPAGPTRAVAIFAHCFTCTMRSHAATRITAALAAVGIATLRFDFTGLGGSEGDFANAGFRADVDDIVAAADYLRETVGAPSILIGHSLGGAAVLAASARVPEAHAVVTIGAPFDAAHVLHKIDGDFDAIRRHGDGEVRIGGRPFRISAKFLDALEMPSEVAERITGLGKALLVLHAPRDEFVSIDNARMIFEAARHPKSFVSLDDADHLLTNARDAVYVASLIASWVERYLPPSTLMATEPTGAGEVRITNGIGKFGTVIRAGRHAITADEPLAIGGDDAGPGPYDFLLSALGTCTAMTLRFYAARESILLDDVTIRLEHDRNHADDCDHWLDGNARVEAIKSVVTLVGDLTDAQRARLAAVAAKCPVHRTLTSSLHIHTTVER